MLRFSWRSGEDGDIEKIHTSLEIIIVKYVY